MKFKFSKELKAELTENGKSWDDLLFKACEEGKAAEVKATDFATALRKTGFRCGTGVARSAYKSVRDGGNLKAMIAAVTAVKAKRKTGTDQGTDNKGTDNNGTDNKGTDNKGTDNKGTDNKGTEPELVEMLEKTLTAARAGHFEIVRMRLIKVKALLAAAELAVARADNKKNEDKKTA